MGLDPVTLGLASLAVTAVSAVGQYQASQAQASAAAAGAQAQKEGIAAQQRMAQVDAQRQRLQQVREARIRRGAILSSAGSQGMGPGTSGVVGSVGSVSSQMAQNIGTIGQTQTFAAEASAANQRGADAASAGAQAQATAAQWQTIGGISNSIFQSQGGWNTIFGGNTSKKAGE